jgi:hypothetical protein
LESCIVQLRATYGISPSDYDADIRWTDPTFDAFLRILEYLRVEIGRTLGDTLLRDKVSRCIIDALATRQLLPEADYTAH